MTEYPTKSVCVVDLGLFPSIASTLAPHFGKTWYYCPGAESQLPKSNLSMIGVGMPGIERIDSPFQVLKDTDLFVFPDVGLGWMQWHLAGLGKQVWGCRMAEELELLRVESKECMKALGIPIGPYTVVTGWKALCEHLAEHEDVWVKVSRYRGDMETWHSRDFKSSWEKLKRLAADIGPKADIMEFIVEETIHDAVEFAYDGFSIDGEFPETSLVGIETKDKGYVGHVLPYEKIPAALKESNAKIAPELKEYQCRSWTGMEIRQVKDGTGYVIDPLTRFGSPPGELIQLMLTNLHEVMYEGAGGKMVKPEWAAEWGVELVLHSSDAITCFQDVNLPPRYAPNVMLRNQTVIGGQRWCIPGCSEVGAIVAMGATLDEAREQAQKISKDVTGQGLDIFSDSLDEAEKSIAKLKEFGVTL